MACTCGASEGEYHNADCERVARTRKEYERDDWYFDVSRQTKEAWGSNIPYTTAKELAEAKWAARHPSPEGMKPAPEYAIDPWGGDPAQSGNFTATELCEERRTQDIRLYQQWQHQINEGHRRAEIMRRERDAHAQKMAAMVLAGNSVIYDPCAGTITAAPASKAFTEDEILAIKNAAFDAGVAAARPAEKPKELAPIHRAMNRMLHADERYENKAFMPGGLLARAGDMA